MAAPRAPAARAVALLMLAMLAASAAAASVAPLTPAAPPMGPFRSGAAPFRARRSAAAASGARAASHLPQPPGRRNAPDAEDLIAQCQLRWRNATLDHFSFAEGDDATFPQRYYVCDGHWRRPAPSAPSAADGGGNQSGPIFLYAGNEADVLLYLNHTGLMWENAARFGALLVFAEHRYYGESRPPPPPRPSSSSAAAPPPATNASAAEAAANAAARRLRARLAHLSASQAMADYAELLRELRADLSVPPDTPVAAFGGSYGGMLASWLRMKYPEAVDAAVASSAPIFNFVGLDPPYPPNAFAAAVTADATPQVGGAAPACAANVRSGWRALAFLSGHGEVEAGEGKTIQAKEAEEDEESNKGKRRRRLRQAAARAMALCDADGDGAALLSRRPGFLAARNWLSSAWDYMAMGDFPYATSYMTNGQGELPAFPVRAACEFLADAELAAWEKIDEGEENGAADGGGDSGGRGAPPAPLSAKEQGAVRLLEAMTRAAGVFFNYTGADVECYEPAGGEDPLSSLSSSSSSSSSAAAARQGGGAAAQQEAAPSSAPLRVSPQMLAVARRFLTPEDVRALEAVAGTAAKKTKATGVVATSSSGSGSGETEQDAEEEDMAVGDDGEDLGGGDDPTALDAFLWDWQYCSEMLMPFGKDGVGDFYWPEPFSLDAAIETCRGNWAGLTPRVGWAVAHYGGRGSLRSATRITFPSGALDPWRPGSPLEMPPASQKTDPISLDAFTLPSGAHHIDTFFSDPADPPDVTAGRRRILDLLARWLEDARAERAEQRRREEQGGEAAAAGAAGAAAAAKGEAAGRRFSPKDQKRQRGQQETVV